MYVEYHFLICKFIEGFHILPVMSFAVIEVVDWLMGTYLAVKTRKYSSQVGIQGFIKRFVYVSLFLVAYPFASLTGDKTIVDSFDMVVWVTALYYLSSIVENCIALGYKVPDVLLKRLDYNRLSQKGDVQKEVYYKEENKDAN